MGKDIFNLQRFIDAQNKYDTYERAIRELLNGKKQTHWIWFILPQMKGLGTSHNSTFYGISSTEEAKAYLEHDVLGTRLRRATEILIQCAKQGNSMQEVLGSIDTVKTQSCFTLFDLASPNEFFAQALNECYNGVRDQRTLEIVKVN